MSVPVKLDELLSAFDWVSVAEAAAVDGEAYINRTDGTIHWVGCAENGFTLVR